MPATRARYPHWDVATVHRSEGVFEGIGIACVPGLGQGRLLTPTAMHRWAPASIPKDYPKGFAVAFPPGFCWNECDCMDDQRPQRPWETRKAWLEDVQRAQAAVRALSAFAEQAQFVRRRGQVSKMFYFETAQGAFTDQTHALAAMDLSRCASGMSAGLLRGPSV